MKMIKSLGIVVFLLVFGLACTAQSDARRDNGQDNRQVKRQDNRQDNKQDNPPEKRKTRFQEMDVDNNGVATLAEMIAHETEKFNKKQTRQQKEQARTLQQYLEGEKKKFKAMDTNGDNKLSQQEIQAAERNRPQPPRSADERNRDTGQKDSGRR